VYAKQLSILATGLLIGCVLATAKADPPLSGIQAFDRGTAAFHAENYSDALADFLEARRDGIDDPQLSYDLGATYYRLGRFAEARQEFTALTKIPSLTALSHYNLGLIAMQRDDNSTARAELNAAYIAAQEPTLQALAQAALQQLDVTPVPGPHWTAFANMGAGYDSNVALTSESTVFTPSHRGSDVYTLLIGTIGQITGNSLDGWQAVGTFYRTEFPTVSQFDQSYIHIGGQYRWSSENWNHMLGFYGGNLSLGDTNFETLVTLNAETRFQLASYDSMHAFYRYTRVTGGSDYGYLTGWHQSLGIEDTLQMASTDLTVGYTFDFNERDNYNAPEQFLSASPTDNGLYAQLNWHVTDATTLFLESDYQHSHYEGADTFVVDGSFASAFRDENWWSASLGVSYSLSQHWSLRLDGSFTDNRSSIMQYSYHSNRIMSSLEYIFTR
jgi:tetratricopeptide (TPR) repeat protein